MKWSWKIGTIAGIDIYVHATFLILIGWIALIYYLQGLSIVTTIFGLFFIITLFGVVVLHELGHALTAKQFGIPTRDIILLPIGGVARLERMPDEPRQELIVALAGPAVNVVIAALLFILLMPVLGLKTLSNVALINGQFFVKLMWVNLILALFNLLPAFPMDGGRVLRAILAMKMDYVRATQIAATLGQGMALLFGFIGLFYNPFLVFIALFVWMGASEEAKIVQLKSAMDGIPIENAMKTDFHILSPDDTLERAIMHLVTGVQKDFPVLKDGRLVGVLTREDLMRGLLQRGQKARVYEVIQGEFETA